MEEVFISGDVVQSDKPVTVDQTPIIEKIPSIEEKETTSDEADTKR